MYMYQNKYMYHTYITNHHNHTKALNDQSPAWSVGRWFNLTSTYMYTSMPVFNFDTMNWGQVQVKSNGFVVLKNLDVLQSNLECLKWIGISPPPALSIIIPKKQGKEKKMISRDDFGELIGYIKKTFLLYMYIIGLYSN